MFTDLGSYLQSMGHLPYNKNVLDKTTLLEVYCFQTFYTFLFNIYLIYEK